MFEQKWKLIVTRRVNIFRLFIMAEGSLEAMEKYLGVRADTLVVTQNERSKYYLAVKDLQSIGRAILSKIQMNSQFPSTHASDCKQISELLVNTAKSSSENISKDLTKDELKTRLEQYVAAHHKFVPFVIIPVAIEQALTNAVNQHIIEKKGNANLTQYLSRLTTLNELPEVMKEQRDLIDLALKAKKSDSIQYNDLLKEHVEKYQWLGCYNTDEPPFDYGYFESRLKALLERDVEELKKEIQNADDLFKSDQKSFDDTIEELGITDVLLGQLKILRNYVYLRTYRIEMQSKSYFFIRGLLDKIAEKLNTDLRTLGGMSPKEICAALNSGVINDLDKVEKRVRNNVLLSENGQIKLYFDNEGDSIIENELGPQEYSSTTKEFRGSTAYKGKVVGIVRILLNKNQIASFNEKEILVTSMTAPEFVPAMKKAAGIITDEGGVLCHAAIVSRELKKPCVIGTKIATEVLKDGDKVQLDADNGLITILNN